MTNSYEGYHDFNYLRIMDDVNHVTHGDWAHHIWLSHNYAVVCLAGALPRAKNLMKVLSGFHEDSVVNEVRDLLGDATMREDLAQVREALTHVGLEREEAEAIERALCAAWNLDFHDLEY